ncbi:MAG: CsgG/HfaB family protein [Deltaproteobacteria bacterium]|nr:CsgG/HfaB family protein [Deltaproteobacteria bacterium]
MITPLFCVLSLAVAATDDTLVVVLPLVGAADAVVVTDELRKQIEAVPGLQVQPKKTTTEHLATAAALGMACTADKPECALTLGGLAGGAIVVTGTLEGGKLAARAFDVGRKKERSSSSTELSADPKADPKARARAIKLLAVRLLAPEREQGTIEVGVQQKGATIVVDGVPRGVSPLARAVEVSPGKHEVYVALIGFESQVQEVNVEFDTAVRIDVQLKAGAGGPALKAVSLEPDKKVDDEAAAAAAAAAVADATAAADAWAAGAAKREAASSALSARGLDARIRALADGLAIPLKRLAGDHRNQRFAVVPFENVGDEATQRSLGLVVSDLITTDLARDHRLGLVERGQIGKLFDELALQQSGAVDDAQVLKLGKLSGARGMVIGRITDAGEDFMVSARAIDAETGSVLVATDVRLPKAELVAFSADAVVLRSRSGAMFRSVVVPGWGQAYNDQTVKGYVAGVVTGGLAAATLITAGLGLYTGYVEYPQAGLSGASAKLDAAGRLKFVEEVRARANTELTASVVLGGATAIAWGATVVDAWLSGVDVESLDAALAKN